MGDGLMKKVPSPRGLLVYPALLSVWLSISCAALFYADIKTAMAGILILAAVSTATMGLFSITLVYGINIITIIVYCVMINVLYGFSPSSLLVMITFVTAEIGTAILAWNTNRQFLSVNRQVERDKLMIDEMRINDEKTGLMRFHYARRALSNEISRGLRYGKTFTLLLLKIENWDSLAETIGLEAREDLLVDICEVLFASCRNVDTLFVNMDKIGVILPETNKAGATVISQRLAEQVFKKTKKDLRTGVVCFPADSISEDDLMRKSEQALKYAEDAGLSRVFFQDIVLREDGSDSKILEQQKEVLEPEPVSIEKVDGAPNIDPEETPVHFVGIHTLKDVENLQKAIGKIPDIGGIRLIDFSEHEIIFGIKVSRNELSEKLLRYLDITNISIEERKDSIVVLLDPSTAYDL
jgi:diguanylate cyclase (GGDEF)-like protein